MLCGYTYLPLSFPPISPPPSFPPSQNPLLHLLAKHNSTSTTHQPLLQLRRSHNQEERRKTTGRTTYTIHDPHCPALRQFFIGRARDSKKQRHRLTTTVVRRLWLLLPLVEKNLGVTSQSERRPRIRKTSRILLKSKSIGIQRSVTQLCDRCRPLFSSRRIRPDPLIIQRLLLFPRPLPPGI